MREFLCHMNIPYRLQSIRSVREGKRPGGKAISGPDVKITCSIGGKNIRVGVELVEYQVDAIVKKGSRGRQFNAFMDKIRQHLKPLLSHNRRLRECFGTLFFDWDQQPNPRDAMKIAQELIRFLGDHVTSLANGERYCFLRKKGPKQGGHFDVYPVLKRYFKKIAVTSLNDLNGPFLWTYNIAAFIGVVEENVLRLIGQKTTKMKSYDWSNVKEMWLLIYAGADIPHDSAGDQVPGNRKLSSRAIRGAAKNSGFDRVIFWEKIHSWHVNLL